MATARGERWSPRELETAVADYCDMLLRQELGERFNKAQHFRALGARLNGRTKAAIEKRHQNTSAALIRLGLPWIDGYKPLSHGEALMLPFVERHVAQDEALLRAIARAVQARADVGTIAAGDLRQVTIPFPRHLPESNEPGPATLAQPWHAPVNYLEREARNASLGRAGEALVVAFERRRLRAQQRPELAERVEHVALHDDGAGFDVQSFEVNGAERVIEVKSTAYGAETPFFVTRHERDVSLEREASYHLYRVFRLRDAPRFFSLSGSLGRTCVLEPESFRARVA